MCKEFKLLILLSLTVPRLGINTEFITDSIILLPRYHNLKFNKKFLRYIIYDCVSKRVDQEY